MFKSALSLMLNSNDEQCHCLMPAFPASPRAGWRIVALMPVEAPEAQTAQNHVIFLENFADELRRKVPTGK